ncbi:MAG: S9 family peptidase, partial [Gammaproteobacteria bacterium]|nr:S9 family peptidase [Gammaproteobacteria bacterium]
PVGWSAHGALLIAQRVAGRTRLALVRAPGAAPQPAPAHPDPLPPHVGAHSAVWSEDGHWVAFARRATDGEGDEIDVLDPSAPGVARVVVTGHGDYPVPLDWSAHDRRLLVRTTRPSGAQRLAAIDLTDGHREPIGPQPARGTIGQARFARDRDGVYWITNDGSDYRELRVFDRATGRTRRLSDAGGDVRAFARSRDGHFLAYTQDEGRGERLHLVDLVHDRELAIPALPAPGIIDSLHFDPTRERLAFAYQSSLAARAAYVLDLAHGTLTAWTRNAAAGAARWPPVIPRRLYFPTFDRVGGAERRLSLELYEPTTGTRHPVLIVFHSGVHGRVEPRFDPWIRFVVDRLGYAVLAPNLRGSSGAGRAFEALGDGRLRGDVVKDVGALLVWLESRPDLDPARVVVAGRGYGGYLALMSAVYYSPRLRGVVDVDGIADLPTYLDGLPPRMRPAMRAAFGDERDPGTRAFLRMLSPLALADRITVPVLIVQGGADRRVPLAQSQTLASLLRVHHVPVWTLIAAREGHRFVRPRDRTALYSAVAEFLRRRALAGTH